MPVWAGHEMVIYVQVLREHIPSDLEPKVKAALENMSSCEWPLAISTLLATALKTVSFSVFQYIQIILVIFIGIHI